MLAKRLFNSYRFVSSWYFFISGLIHRVHIKRKTEPTEKKKYKKTFDGPRQRPSDGKALSTVRFNMCINIITIYS